MQLDTCSLWIYLHFTQLQLDLIEHSPAADDETLAEPRAIYQVQDNQIVQINSAANKRGIKVGMGLASASLLDPKLKLHEYNGDLEKGALQHLANALYLISSDIVIIPPNGLVLRAQNMLALYGGLSTYWHHILQCLKEHGYQYQGASGFSIQAAKLMAKQGLGIISQDRLAIQKKLSQCALTPSDIDYKDLDKLKRIGIQSMEELTSIPLSELANRLSRYSINIIAELRGQAPSKVSFFQPLTRYDDYIELLYDISLVDKLIPVLGHAFNKLETFLYTRNACCLHVAVDFYQREHVPKNIKFDSALAIYKQQDWLNIASLKLERVRFESPVYALKLICKEYETAHMASNDFFAEKSSHIATLSLVSRLASKLGQSKVKRLTFMDDFRPERTTQYGSKLTEKSRPNKQNCIFADRPGVLLEQPVLLQQKILIIKGPERIVSGWWDNVVVTRDYYIGQSSQGQQMWVFKTPEQSWYLHGYFV
jgi:protein ImuB